MFTWSNSNILFNDILTAKLSLHIKAYDVYYLWVYLILCNYAIPLQAAYLQKAGLNVCVLERRHLIGGAAVTEEIVPGILNCFCSFLLFEFILWRGAGLVQWLCNGLPRNDPGGDGVKPSFTSFARDSKWGCRL